MTDNGGPEGVYEALRDAVRALGGAKRVGSRLRPERHGAERWLLDCLNPDRDQKLDPEQVFLILRWAGEAGYHDAKHFLDQATGYAPSAPLALEAQLLQALAEARAAQKYAEEKTRDLQTLADNPRLLAAMKHVGLKVET